MVDKRTSGSCGLKSIEMRFEKLSSNSSSCPKEARRRLESTVRIPLRSTSPTSRTIGDSRARSSHSVGQADTAQSNLVLVSDLEQAWAELMESTPRGWYVGAPRVPRRARSV